MQLQRKKKHKNFPFTKIEKKSIKDEIIIEEEKKSNLSQFTAIHKISDSAIKIKKQQNSYIYILHQRIS